MGLNIKNFFPAAGSAELKLSPGKGTETGPFGVSNPANTEGRTILHLPRGVRASQTNLTESLPNSLGCLQGVWIRSQIPAL